MGEPDPSVESKPSAEHPSTETNDADSASAPSDKESEEKDRNTD
jgi:hypothetical protein